MHEVLLINPSPFGRRKRTKGATQTEGVRTMARRRRSSRRRNEGNPKKKYHVYARPARRRRSQATLPTMNPRRRRNPSNRFSSPRSRGLGSFLSVDLGGIGRALLPMAVGAVAGQIASKKLDADDTTGGASQPWSWKNYLLAILGSYVGGMVMSFLKPSAGRYVRNAAVQGGLLLVIYQLVTKELTAKSTTVAGLLGETGTSSRGGDAWRHMKPGDVWQGTDGKQYLLGSDNQWKPLGLLGSASLADIVDAERYGELVNADRYGEDTTPESPSALPSYSDPYYRQYMPF